MRMIIGGFAGRTYHIVGIHMSWLKFVFFFSNKQYLHLPFRVFRQKPFVDYFVYLSNTLFSSILEKSSV